jgi:thiamine biosynthesis protein ThiS
MSFFVNGEPRTAPAGQSVADLLRELGLQSDRIAVELNLEIVERADFSRRTLKDGDRIEILSFIGGGAEARVRQREWW